MRFLRYEIEKEVRAVQWYVECNILTMRNFFQLIKIPEAEDKTQLALGLVRRKEASVAMLIRRVEAGDQESVLRLLRTAFYPYEPCAVGLDLCPLGYR